MDKFKLAYKGAGHYSSAKAYEAFAVRPLVCFCRAVVLMGVVASLLAMHSAHAANVTWDITPGVVGSGNGTVTGGAGTWDLTNGNWTIDGGINNIAWVNANNDTAVFGGTAGTVTLGTGITIGGLLFNTTAYNITNGANTLTFGASNNTLAFNSVAAATITGTVGGTGSNLILSALSPSTAGNLTFSGVSTGGWTGTTTINTGMTLTTTTASTLINQVLNSTSGITLNGGAIQFNRATNAQLNAISDSAPITVNGGGTLNVTSADAGGTNAIENIGTVTVNSGQMNFNWTNVPSSGGQMIMSGLNLSGSTTAATFSGTLANNGRWKVTGAGSTPAGQIFGPRMTTGGANGIAVQTDYAVFNTDFVAAAGIAASAESTWTNAANAYTSNAGVGAIQLTGTRNITALRSISSANTVTITANSATIAQATHAFNVGDPVVFGASSMPAGLTSGTVYYVVSTATGTFQVAATPGGTAITPTTTGTSVNVTGALQVSSGNNLGTTGILNGVANTLTIAATGTGAVTLPTTTAGNLFITPGTGPITINAPIQDNTGALTLVKSDTGGTLTLNGANTFTGGLVIHMGGMVISNNAGNTYSGGITINGGSLTPVTDTGLGNTSQTITFGAGNGALIFSSYGSGNSSARTGAINVSGAGTMQMSFQTGPNIAMPITGAGTLTLSSTSGSNSGTTFTSTGSTFTGPLILANPANVTINMNSLGDSSNTIQLGTGTNTSTSILTYAGSAALSSRGVVLGGGASTAEFDGNGTGLVTFSQNLAFAGAGAKIFILGGTNASGNVFSGNMTNNADGSAISLTKAGAGTWALAGTNTYSGTTVNALSNPAATVGLIFRGMQAVSPSTSLSQTHPGGVGGFGTIKLLDDSGIPAPRTSTNLSMAASNTTHSMTLFVGNNNTTNGGSSSGTTTGSTISLGNLNFTQTVSGNTSQTLAVTGANSYRLQINNVNLPGLQASSTTWNGIFNPTSAPLTIAGTVQQATGNVAGSMTLTLDGSATSNQITGNILNSADGTPKALSITKSNSSVWTLSGNNSFSGTLTLSGATVGSQLNINSATALGTGTFSISGGNNAKFDNTSGSAITLTTNNAQTWSNDFAFIGSNSLNMGTGTITMGGTRTVTVSANNLTVGAISSNAFALTKSGNGTLSLSGAAAYTGATTVSFGTLNILSANMTSGVAIGTFGTLRGTGSLTGTGAITFSGAGTVFPGDATLSSLTDGPKGNLTAVTANFNTNGGTLKIRALSSGPTGSMTSDSLTISAGGTLTLGTNSKLELRIQSFTSATNSAQDALIVDNGTTGGSNTTFGSVTITYPASGQTGVELVYASAGFTPNSTSDTDVSVYGTQLPGAGFVANSTAGSATSFNKIYLRLVANGVTPVKIADFSAKAEGAGVNLSWTCVSEFQNAGFNIYRQLFGETEWTRVNPSLIAGRITNSDEKIYTYYDWAGTGMVRYKLESIAIDGSNETYAKFAESISVDALQVVDAVDANGLDGIDNSLQNESSVTRATAVSAAFGPVEHGNLIPAIVRDLNAGSEPNAVATVRLAATPHVASPSNAVQPSMAARWFTSGSSLGSAKYTAAKVQYVQPGVLAIPQSSLPAGFDINHVAIQREGRTLPILALQNNTLYVCAPGYTDDYTSTDALFVRSTMAPTSAGSVTHASGLFSISQPVNSNTPSSVTSSYHDVYFDYSYRPFTFTPWFSGQYLTDGTDQVFSLNTPFADSGPGALTVTLWSLTCGAGVTPDHALQVAINGTPVGQAATWTGGQKMMQLTLQVPSGILRAGANQIDLVTPTLPGVSSQVCFVHALTMTYSRTLDGSHPVTVTNFGVGSQVFELSNIPSANVWIVDTRFPDRTALVPYEAQAQNDGTYRVRFNGASGGTGQYLVVPSGQENAPAAVSKRVIKSISSTSYLATGPNAFGPGVQPLLMKRSKEGLRSQFVDQEQLFDYYNYGRYGPSGIQNAIRSARPQYLLLVGRTTYDYHNYSGANVDPLCPAFLVSTTFWAQTTSDSMFGDLGRGYPEVAVGRLPINNTTELTGAVQHILTYNGAPISGIRVHAVADQADPSAGNFPAQAAGMSQALPDMMWQANYLGVTSQTSPQVTAAMSTAANGGADWLVYVGHGNAVGLGNESPRILDTNSVQSWTGNSVFLQSTCTGNWMAKDVQDYKSIAIQALIQPQGGISASIGTSTYMNSDYAVAFMTQLMRVANTPAMRWGDALMKTQKWASQQGQSYYDDLNRTEQLFGDPAMPVFNTKPSAPNSGASSNAAGTF